MIKYPKFLGAGAAKDTGAINCVVSLPRLRSVCSGLQLSRPHYQGVFLAYQMMPPSPQFWLWNCGNTGAGDAGPSADHRVTQRDDNKTCGDWGRSDQSEARGEARWPMRGRDQASDGPVCQWPGVATRRPRQVPLRLRLSQLWSSDNRGHRPETGSAMRAEYLTHRDTDTAEWSVQSRSIQDLWIDSFAWWCTVTNKNLTNNK